MGTIRNPGLQFNPKGVTQGNTLVDPNTGYPITVIEENDGSRRLAVDANLSIDDVTVNIRDLSPVTDGVYVGDSNGNKLLVQSDGSINVNAILNASTDNIAIADASSGNKLLVNSDGSINVNLVSASPGTEFNIFSSITSIPSGVNTLIQSYTVSAGKTDLLQQIEVSGTNIAKYEIYLNSTIMARKYTFFGNSLDSSFLFNNLKLSSGDLLQVYVLHNRPFVGDFNSRISLTES